MYKFLRKDVTNWDGNYFMFQRRFPLYEKELTNGNLRRKMFLLSSLHTSANIRIWYEVPLFCFIEDQDISSLTLKKLRNNRLILLTQNGNKHFILIFF